MNNDQPDLQTLMEDVKTIKSILQTQDAPFPRLWRITWTVATAVALAGLLQYFVPFFRALDFDGKILWLWLPLFCVVFPTVLLILASEIRRIGKRFLSQGRFRHLLFARFVIPPAVLTLIWLASRNTTFSLEGTILVIAAMAQTVIEQAVPEEFRTIPLSFLLLGLVELGFHLTGPEVTLFNIGLAVSALTWVGFMFRERERRGNV